MLKLLGELSTDPATASDGDTSAKLTIEPEKLAQAQPELEIYTSTLVLTTAMRESKMEQAAALSIALLARINQYNRRSLDTLASKVTFYYALVHERLSRLPEIRPKLLALHRTSCLRHDDIGQAVALNLLLRNLLSQNLLDQAYKLATKTNFPESASNNQFSRYLFYMGRIQALQLDYSDAFSKLTQSSRKAPQNTALPFRLVVQKHIIIVQQLLGEVPERSMFNQTGLRIALQPYLELTQSVRLGNLNGFHDVVERHGAVFRRDSTFTLIQRLAHNVIKTGLRKVNLSYSKISLADVCSKVQLESVASAEFVCAKAVRDGVIDATINHEEGCMESQEQLDLYATGEPQQAYHKRITFCLDVHNEAVKAMRYPQNAHKKAMDKSRSSADEKTDEELAKEIEDEMAEED
ncbi:unnamed protein product [Chrysoparadoxa australica]